MATVPDVAIEAATGTTGSDGLAVFTFSVDIDSNRQILVDRLPQGETIDFTVTGARQITFIAPSIPVAGAQIWLLNGATVGVSISTGLPSWDTVAEIVSDAAIEVGLIPIAIADPFASAERGIPQLLGLLKKAGRVLVREREWTHLQQEFTFSTANGVAVYSLPSDFRALINQSGWNRTTMFELGGPLSAEEWQYTKAVPFGASITSLVRFQGGQLSITPTPTAVETIAFEYLTTHWIRPVGQTSPTLDAPAAATDVVCFDPPLAVAALVLEWKNAKGFDTGAAQADYMRALGAGASGDSAAPVIYLGSRPSNRMLGIRNMPITGIGQ